MIGLFLTGLISHLAAGSVAALPSLIAPMGASAVLLSAEPLSALDQPWSILGGNLVPAIVDVAAAASIADPLITCAVGGSVAIALLLLLGCLHPPSGAVALETVHWSTTEAPSRARHRAGLTPDWRRRPAGSRRGIAG